MNTEPNMMKLLKQREELDKKIAEAKDRERAGVLRRVLEALHAYDIARKELYRPGTSGRPLPLSGETTEITFDAPERTSRIELVPARKPAKKGAPKKTNGKAKAKKVGRYPIKYRNPADHNETWTGRGRMSNWLEQKLKAGHTKDEFLIQ